MFFLMRAAFWLTVVFLAMPVEHRPTLAGDLSDTTGRLIADAQQRIATGCAEKDRTCIDGALIAEEFGMRAANAVMRLATLALDDAAPAPMSATP